MTLNFLYSRANNLPLLIFNDLNLHLVMFIPIAKLNFYERLLRSGFLKTEQLTF